MTTTDFSPRRQMGYLERKPLFYLNFFLRMRIRNIFGFNAFFYALCVFVIQSIFPDFSFSQTISSTAALVTPLSALGASARADAMGSAFTGVADDSSALFFNSAGLSGLNNAQLSLNHNSYLGGSFEETLLVGLPAGDLGGFAGAIQSVFWGSLDERNALGVELGNFQDNDVALSLGWGKEWAKGFSIGVALLGTQQKIVDSLYDSLSGQVGLLWRPIPDLRLGLVYSGFGTAVASQALVTDAPEGRHFHFVSSQPGSHSSLIARFLRVLRTKWCQPPAGGTGSRLPEKYILAGRLPVSTFRQSGHRFR